MLFLRRFTILLLAGCFPIAGCANSPLGESLQRSVAADPRLTGSPSPAASPTVSPTVSPIVTPTPGTATENSTPDPSLSVPNATDPDATPAPSPQPSNSPSVESKTTGLGDLAAFSDRTQIGVASSPVASSPTNSQPATSEPASFSDLDKTPKELRQYVVDLARLGVLTAAEAKPNASKQTDSKLTEGRDRLAPNQTTTRREYARWLVATNNRLFADRSAQQIRAGSESSQPAFRDVPRSDPDFAAIQGLAEAGLIPSSLTGDGTTVTFRPNDPLTRESLVLWKVPIDTRQPLPSASIQAIQQTWGFQDAARIEARALKAVLVDFQNGDQSNIRRAFGYTTLFQPKKPVTRAEAAATLWYIGYQGEGRSAQNAVQ